MFAKSLVNSARGIKLCCFLQIFHFKKLQLTWLGAFSVGRHASSMIVSFDASAKKLPMREAVRYTETNTKWTAEEFLVRILYFIEMIQTLYHGDDS